MLLTSIFVSNCTLGKMSLGIILRTALKECKKFHINNIVSPNFTNNNKQVYSRNHMCFLRTWVLQKHPPEVFCKKGAHKILKINNKRLVLESLFSKVEGFPTCNLIKNETPT